MYIFPQTAKNKRVTTETLSPTIFRSTLNFAITERSKAALPDKSADVFVTFPARTTTDEGYKRTVHVTPLDLLRSKCEWSDRDFREGYAEAAVEQGIAWQLKVNRERRGLSQKQLAQMTCTKQSSISRMEDPEYGRHSLANLVKLAAAFDCALLVKFVGFSTLARESQCLSADHLYAPSFTEEVG